MDAPHFDTHLAQEPEQEHRSTHWPPDLLAGSREGLAGLPALLGKASAAALAARRRAGPFPAGTTQQVLSVVSDTLGPSELPGHGIGAEAALRRLAALFVGQGLDLSHPRAAAHLQPPPLSVAVAADALASASNASLDTYDSGPSAIGVERWLIAVLIKLARLGPRADGVLTPGGSLSNLLGLLLARDAAALRCGVDARRDGVGALPRPVVLCSELAHFSVQRACAALGLGEEAVRVVPVDRQRRMRCDVAARMLGELASEHTPLALIATAGTTDFGSIDPLPELGALAAERGVWFHVDAAYGFGALFSDRLAPRLSGLARADSITLDLHKLGWQPAAASMLLVADAAAFQVLEREVAYLNPSDDAEAGLDGLLGRSLQTTRRADALKVAVTLLAHGKRGLGAMVDQCHALACYAAERIALHPELELVARAELTTVVFRFSAGNPAVRDELNGALRRRLLESGTALIGRTSVKIPQSDARASVCLKLTLLNPTASLRDIDELLEAVTSAGQTTLRALQEHSA